MYLIVTAAWLAAFAGNIMAHPNDGTDPAMAGLGGPPPLSVTMAPPDGAMPPASDAGTIDDDRPAVQTDGVHADDAGRIYAGQASPASFEQASSNTAR